MHKIVWTESTKAFVYLSRPEYYLKMNKKILITLAVVAIAAIVIGYAIAMPTLLVKAQEEKTKQITLAITNKRFAHERLTFTNESAGQWVFTITNISGNVKFIKILIYKHERPYDGFTWAKLNPNIGDSITVKLTAGDYTLRIVIAGAKNSTLTLTVAYP